jgi:DNA polymerase-3 subunit delta
MIYLLHGKNTFLSLKEAKSVIDKIKVKREKDGTKVDTLTADASTENLEKIINEIETPSFLSNHKIIFLKRPTQNKDKEKIQEWIIALASKPKSPTGIDIILWEDQKLRSNMRLVKVFKEKNKIYESPYLNKRTFITWAKKQLSPKNINLTTDAIYTLSQKSNYDPERFFHEVEKLALLGKENITIEDIEEVSPNTLEHTIWELIDDINDGKTEVIGEKLNDLITQGNEPHFILSMIARNLRLIFMTTELDKEGMSSSEIAKKLGTAPFVIGKIKHKSQKMKPDKIKMLYEKLTGIDYSTKTGQIEIELALNLLVSVI